MSKHVVLLTDAHEAPAYELIEALRAAGVRTLIEGLREVEAEIALARNKDGAGQEENAGPPPLAVLYEVVPGADIVELQTATAHAKAFWPGAPLVACRRHGNGYQKLNLNNLDGAALKRLGFRAIADKAAQLPALLREIEGHGATAELKLPEIIQKPSEPNSLSLPPKLKAKSLRAAFELVSSLHFIGDQIGAAHTALAGLDPLVNADRWTIYLLSDAAVETSGLEVLAVRKRGQTNQMQEDWQRLFHAQPGVLPRAPSKAAKLAAAGMGILRRKEQGNYIVAVPLVSGDRMLGVIEGVREEKDSRSFRKSEIA